MNKLGIFLFLVSAIGAGSLFQNGSQPVNITRVGGTLVTTAIPVSGTLTATVSGVATATKQSDGSQKSQIVDGSANVIGSTSNALDINIKSGNLTTLPVTNTGTFAAQNAPTVATTGGTTTVFQNAAVSSTAIAVKASAGNIYTITCSNPDATTECLVEIFNTAQGSVSVGTTTPVWFIRLAAGASQNLSLAMPITCGTAISCVAVTGHLLSGSSAPATAVNVCINYN